jgi:hypothetical protein
MGLIGNNPYYGGPSPFAAGASAFGDNFLKTYLALQTNAREQQAQELKAQLIQAQMEQMELEKQAQQQAMQRQASMQGDMAQLPIQNAMGLLQQTGGIDPVTRTSDPAQLAMVARGAVPGLMPTMEQQVGVLQRHDPLKAMDMQIKIAEMNRKDNPVLELIKAGLDPKEIAGAIGQDGKIDFSKLTGKKDVSLGVEEQYDPRTHVTFGRDFIQDKKTGEKTYVGSWRPVKGRESTTIHVGGEGGPGKAPIGYRFTKEGNLEPIPGGPADFKAQDRAQAQASGVDTLDKSLATVDRLLSHPGRETATGLSSLIHPANYIRGTKAVDFQRELESFDAQMFLSSVKSMKGMGQLSDAEGKKISAAVGAIKPGMSDESIVNNLGIIRDELTKAKTRMATSAVKTPRAVVGRRRGKDGSIIVKYSDGTFGRE